MISADAVLDQTATSAEKIYSHRIRCFRPAWPKTGLEHCATVPATVNGSLAAACTETGALLYQTPRESCWSKTPRHKRPHLILGATRGAFGCDYARRAALGTLRPAHVRYSECRDGSIVVRDDIIIVNPSHKIVAVVPTGFSGAAQPPAARGAALNLTRDQIP
jgi:hypothetical protein